MKRLIDRMRICDRETLMEASKEYPASLTPLIGELKTKSFYSELTYEMIGLLVSHLRLSGYGPSHIAGIFPNE